jgi:type IV secretory pathway ATPase VirB11/archaellum biosynthesis ATPase
MRADYVVLSECVGPEVGPFLEMVRNNCTGITLVSGENVFDVIKRMQTKTVLSSDGYSIEEANYALAQTFSYVIFQEKRADGKRVISSISETSYSAGELKLKIIYKK